MKILLILTMTFCALNVFAQSKTDLEKIIETEKSFARYADENGVKPAFLEFLADDAVMFTPVQTNGKAFWQARPERKTALAWYPVFADVSSNGVLGYTTGHAEFRPEGKGTDKVFYTDFFTIWRRQPNGNYKAVLDVGVSHDRLPSEDKTVVSPKTAEKFSEENKPLAANAMSSFFDAATTNGLSRAYKNYAAQDVRFLREGQFPITGKKDAPPEIKKSKITFGKNVTMQSAGNLGYAVTTYEMKDGDKTIEQGNIIQVWKLLGGKWQIVMDVFAPIPEK